MYAVNAADAAVNTVTAAAAFVTTRWRRRLDGECSMNQMVTNWSVDAWFPQCWALAEETLVYSTVVAALPLQWWW